MLPMRLPPLSPPVSLGLAILASVTAHATAMLLMPGTASGLQRASFPESLSRAHPPLAVQLAAPKAMPSPPEPQWAVVLDTPLQLTETSPQPPLPDRSLPSIPDDPVATSPLQDRVLPVSYRKLSELTREPELQTPVDERDWPNLPSDIMPGSFELELAIGTDGAVDLVVPHCDEPHCPAAGAYMEVVRRWHFRPGEILGQPMPSRLRIAFDVGIKGGDETAQPRQ